MHGHDLTLWYFHEKWLNLLSMDYVWQTPDIMNTYSHALKVVITNIDCILAFCLCQHDNNQNTAQGQLLQIILFWWSGKLSHWQLATSISYAVGFWPKSSNVVRMALVTLQSIHGSSQIMILPMVLLQCSVPMLASCIAELRITFCHKPLHSGGEA